MKKYNDPYKKKEKFDIRVVWLLLGVALIVFFPVIFIGLEQMFPQIENKWWGKVIIWIYKIIISWIYGGEY